MKNIITQSLEKSYTYQQYRSFVTKALENNPEILELEEGYLPYAELNETRLNRLDKTITVASSVEVKLQQLKGQYIWLVISESWCGDAAQILPILHKMSEVTPAVDLVVVFRDQNEELMEEFLTNGGKAIPKVIVLDKATLEVLADWGPRPVGAQKTVDDYKAANGQFDDEGIVALQKWYAKDKGIAVQREIEQLMSQLD
ncbi:thioredoxin family protein [Flavobacterium sp. NKUCC04_CG]|uniref:thioredoxin family protein n=1 Tax=Flavobacterium sp. NKUCC04_CG TaxID=2842121 RepID=UPI001C5B9825|nr:thioredoxin family protein [Flavobacterium sp. NKUCC04_CG]MBW3518251.1 thioredoxin family protein [Flavobacterium sp. NKUCC04_CG]